MNSDSKKEKFINICRDKIRRSGREELLEWLEQSDFFSAPASTKYHGCYEGGLCEHSLNVYDQLLLLLRTYNLTTSEETAAIVALFHDLCKVNFYKKSTRNVKDENGKWVEKEFWTIEEQSPLGDHADKSIIIIQQFMKLTEQEINAIRAHMGGFDTSVKGGSYFIGKIFEKSGLALLLHCADLTATYLLESRSKESVTN